MLNQKQSGNVYSVSWEADSLIEPNAKDRLFGEVVADDEAQALEEISAVLGPGANSPCVEKNLGTLEEYSATL